MKDLDKTKAQLIKELQETRQELISVTALKSAEASKHKQIKNILLESPERLDFFVENSPLAIIEWDSNFVVTKWTGNSEKIFGWSSDETIGISVMDLNMIYETDISIVQNSIDMLTHGINTHVVSINRNYRKDKKIIYCEWHNTALKDQNGNLLYVLSEVLDITDRKRTEEELIKAKEKAEESDRLKTAFIANMSHEIRTPMNGILGFAELLKEPNLSGEEQHEYIKIIEKSGARMLNIINDIIDISKIESGLIKVNINESNINSQIDYIYTFFKPEVERKGMKLIRRSSLPDKEAIIKTDREKLFAILTNLVMNAIKYSEQGSIEFGYEKKYEYLEFYVKDSGIGIKKERLTAIFERFVQEDISDVKARQGAGLGLTITKSYVEMLGGEIWVESEIGVGSTFYFTIPFDKAEDNQLIHWKRSIKNHIGHVANLKILIVEDDEISEYLVNEGVKIFGKEILKATTGDQAIETCRNNSDIDLVLMDIQLPILNGYEATQQIRQFNKDVVIIAQTAYGLFGDREKAIKAGCNDYLSKPIDKSELHSLISKHCKIKDCIERIGLQIL